MTFSRQTRPIAAQPPRGAICIDVAPGVPLPEPGGVIVTQSPLTDLVYRLTIKRLVRLEWAYDSAGDIVGLRVWVRGEKEVVAL